MGKGDASELARPSSTSAAAQLQSDGEGGGGGEGQQRETISCPSSPTETDCSSGFSTLRRRSVTLTEKVTGRAHWHTCFISSHTCFVVVFT